MSTSIDADIITKEFIGKGELIKIFEASELKYTFNRNTSTDEIIYVSDGNDWFSLAAFVNCVDENGICKSERDTISSYNYAGIEFPIKNGHLFSIEYVDKKVLEKFLETVKKLYPGSYFIDEFLDVPRPI